MVMPNAFHLVKTIAGEADNLKNNWLAKFLLPLLGKRRRASMMRKIREEAEKCGMEIPDDMEKIFEKPTVDQFEKGKAW